MQSSGTANAILPTEVRSELDRILASPQFRSAPRLKGLLRFFGDRYLQSAPIPKEHEIATQVFERPESFDPSIDSLVRVHASRLRQKLREFYTLEPRAHPFEIHLAKNTYQLEVVLIEQESPVRAPAEVVVSQEEPLPPSPGLFVALKNRQAAGIATVCLLLVAGIGLFRERSASSESSTPIRLTRAGTMAGTAKFSVDGKRILFSFRPPRQAELRLHSAEAGSQAEPVALGYDALKLFSVSQAGLLFLDSQSQLWMAAELGSPAKTVARDIVTARWDSKRHDAKLLVVRELDKSGTHVLEYPQGTVLASHSTGLGHPFQFAMPSRDGRWIAYGRPSGKSTDYDLWVMDTRDRSAKILMPNWTSLGPFAFSASGEIVVGGIVRSKEPAIYRIHPSTGKVTVARVFTHMTILEDIRDDDSMIVREVVKSHEIFAKLAGQSAEAKLDLGEEFIAVGISPDGTKIILASVGSKDAENQDLYLFDITKKTRLAHLGLGTSAHISSDGRQLLTARITRGRGHAVAIDLDSRAVKDLSLPGYSYLYPSWNPSNDGSFQFLNQGDSPPESYVQDANGASCKRIDASRIALLTSDVVAMQRGEQLITRELSTGMETTVGRNALAGLQITKAVLSSGRFLAMDASTYGRYYLVDPVTGVRQLWKQHQPGPDGQFAFPLDLYSRDGKQYAYTVMRERRSLFFVRN